MTALFIQTWRESRTRFSNLLVGLTEADLRKKLVNTSNSAGFLVRHIADLELLFAKNILGQTDLNVNPKTLAAQRDTGEWTSLRELLDYQLEAFNQLLIAIEKQSDQEWQQTITTNELGTKTKAEALGRIMSHTAYHAGQLALTIKYGVRSSH